MDQLFHKIGLAPYRLDQIIPLLDEASSLTSDPEDITTQYHDTAIKVAESLEALTWLVDFCLAESFPQFSGQPDPAEIERLELYNDVYITPNERDILDSIGPKTLHLKSWVFGGSQQPLQSSRSALGTAQLCQYCNWPFQRLAKGPNEEAHLPELPGVNSLGPRCFLLAIDDWPALPLLKERSLQGCEFCLFLREHLLSDSVPPPEESDESEESDERRVRVWIEFFWDVTRSLASVSVSLHDSENFLRTLSFTIDTVHENVADSFRIFRSPAAKSLEPANLDFIKRQLASTDKSAATSRYRPKRLLDLGVSTQSELKLINGQELVDGLSEPRYATLSYCWGSVSESKKQLKLTSETQRIFYSSIPRSLRIPVLRDAITICHILGMRYLWVDSLCIQQDGDGRDWEEHSEEMSHIFGNSWLTICAPASNSCLNGFLDHTDRHSSHIEIGYVAKESQQIQGSFFLRLLTINGKPGHGDARAARLPPLVRDLEYSKWNTRGWVFQERILLPRLLYFGARMIHFQHGDHVISEDGSSFDGNFFDHTFFAYRHCSTNLVRQLEVIQNHGPFAIDLWYRLITVMAPSNFTDRRDTFPAIAGVARRMSEFTKHRYVAGLWEEDLCCGLLWKPRLTSRDLGRGLEPRRAPASLQQLLQTVKKSTNWIAPSWSWANRRSCLQFMITNQINTTCRVRRHLRVEYKILELPFKVEGLNPYGRISSASISLSGLTIKVAPSSLSPVQNLNGYDRFQVFELFPGLFALVDPDWRPIERHRDTGVKRQMRAHFELLAIASCCSDWSSSGNTERAYTTPRNERAESGAEPAHRSQAGVWSGKKVTPEEAKKKNLEAMKSKYRRSFYGDSHPGFDAAVDCNLCSDHKLRRDIWGLLIYPAGPMSTYYRVGTFFSRAEHGGSAIFEGIEPRKLELV